MFALFQPAPFPTPSCAAPTFHAPALQSPLTPRDPNARRVRAPGLFDVKAMAPSEPENCQQAFSFKPAPLPQTGLAAGRPERVRASKFAPLLQRKDAGMERERRKDVYLRGIRDRREEARWEARGETSLRRDFFEEQREWAAAQSRAAEEWQVSPEEVEEVDEEMDEAEETYDLPEMLEEPDEFNYDAAFESELPSSDFGGDGEYERLLLEAAAEAEARRLAQHEFTGSFGEGGERDVWMG